VVMTYAILRSTEYITEQLERVTSVLGGGGIELSLIDTSQVISPVFISVVVGIYLMEIVLVLSVFQTQIETVSDKYQIFSAVNSNILSFFIYSGMLFAGYYFVTAVLFQSILA